MPRRKPFGGLESLRLLTCFSPFLFSCACHPLPHPNYTTTQPARNKFTLQKQLKYQTSRLSSHPISQAQKLTLFPRSLHNTPGPHFEIRHSKFVIRNSSAAQHNNSPRSKAISTLTPRLAPHAFFRRAPVTSFVAPERVRWLGRLSAFLAALFGFCFAFARPAGLTRSSANVLSCTASLATTS